MKIDDLLKKYNVPVPRYTSYPPANYFDVLGEKDYLEEVERTNSYKQNNISFYVHVPFCRHLCHYCGCNSMAIGSAEKVGAYVDALHREIDLLLPRLSKDRKISQIHYGGGSPSQLPVSAIKELNDHLLQGFATIEKPEIAIEVHPGYLTEDDWHSLAACGFTRMSLGVQDFNPQVLRNVNRRGALIDIEQIFSILKGAGIRINMDFLYGLPGQSVESFARTIEQAVALRPHRLVTFSYAHVPWVNKRQQILEKIGLPEQSEKAEMFEVAKRLLVQAGYCQIGMDHFVEPDDDLGVAFREHTLHRNFQGYCTRSITAQVYAFGVSGISQTDGMYAQNSKDVDQYIATVNDGHLPIAKGYRLTDDQQVTREVIETLMCNYRIDWDDVAARLGMSVEAVKSATAYNEDKLAEMQQDGLMTYNAKGIVMAEGATPFVRNVAASLDKLMTDSKKSFSKPL